MLPHSNPHAATSAADTGTPTDDMVGDGLDDNDNLMVNYNDDDDDNYVSSTSNVNF